MKLSSLQFRGNDYSMHYSADFGQFRVFSKYCDNFYYWLTPLFRIDRPGSTDRTITMPKIEVISSGHGELKARVVSRSSLWSSKEAFFEFYLDRFEFFLRVEGTGALDRIYFLMGLLDGRAVGSTPGFDFVYPGCPNFLGNKYFAPYQPFSINVGLDTTYWGPALNSGPLFYAFLKEGIRHAISAGIIARPGENTFQCFDFNHKPKEVLKTHDNIVNTQSFSLGYFGNVKINGVWESPRMVFQFGKNQYDCLYKYCRLLERRGVVPDSGPAGRAWWRRPIFCGWHEQTALGLKKNLLRKKPLSEIEITPLIFDECTQRNHKAWINILRKNRVPVGTIIIDAAWQKQCGTFEVDKRKWPDLRGFVDFCHKIDLKVLLWIPAWSTAGVPDDECIMRDGKPVAVDPTAPKYQQRLLEGIRMMLGCLDADGLKIDSTAGIPIGYHLKTQGGIYGFELQHYYMNLIYQKAKEIKRDALISVYIANPYFRDVCDMVRAGDLYSVYGRPVDTLKERVRVIRLAMKNKIVDTDGNMRFSMADDVAEELREQVDLGIPTIYGARHVCQHRVFNVAVFKRLSRDDYAKIGGLMRDYIHKSKWERNQA